MTVFVASRLDAECENMILSAFGSSSLPAENAAQVHSEDLSDRNCMHTLSECADKGCMPRADRVTECANRATENANYATENANSVTEFADCTSHMCGGIHIVRLPRFAVLDAPVSDHPDMLLFAYKERILCPEAYYIQNENIFAGNAGSVPTHTHIPEYGGICAYPDDIALNALRMRFPDRGDVVLCRADSASRELLSMFDRGNIINIRQGYAACSACKVTERAIITADRGEALAAERLGADVLLISPGGIALPGYDTGFIGGASARIGDALFFFGDPMLHPDGERIMDFVQSHIGEKHALEDETPLRRIFCAHGVLRDYGGAVVCG